MDKYIGNKKSIVENLEQLMKKKEINNGIFFDAFSGTTNVSQYFKQRGFDIIASDSNSFSKIFGNAYVVNNTFPTYKKLLTYLEISMGKIDDKVVKSIISKAEKKVVTDKIFQDDYLEKSQFTQNIIPLAKVICYMNDISPIPTEKNDSFFFDYYTIYGSKSEYSSLRGTIGKRNYFSAENSLKLGILLNRLKQWRDRDLISDIERDILLTSIIEEVTLVANVAGTFHDFNREKLYPNAIVDMKLRVPILNINGRNKFYKVYQGDTNRLFSDQKFGFEILGSRKIEIMYLDPPYNFRQYSDYYHLLNFIADYHLIDNLDEYGEKLSYVRGQNMSNSFKSQYSYKDSFEDALKELISNTLCKHIIISYYDENNHWSHGKKEISFEGRQSIISALEQSEGVCYVEKEPYSVKRLNYQSRKGENKKNIDELFFYGRKKL